MVQSKEVTLLKEGMKLKNIFIYFRTLIRNLTELQIVFVTFIVIILIGGLLLSLPIASKTGSFTSVVDALFTAVSATCVTGLTVLNTSTHWSVTGQMIILVLIQIGGLGFMTMVASLFLLLNQKVSLKSRLVIQKSYSLAHIGFRKKVVTGILTISLSIELIGSILLSIVFIPEYGLKQGVWFALFHAISAYCNAGFDLFGDSLTSFQSAPYVLMVISFLIVFGSLGFVVIMELLDYKRQRRFSLHSKLALIMTGLLIAIGAILFLLTEASHYSNNVLIYTVQSLFLSVTPRTAGFAIQDYSSLNPASIFLTILLMTVGGTSGSTAGGLKTTTLGVFMLNIRAIIKREKYTILGKRTIPQNLVKQSYESIFLYTTITLFSTFLLLVLEQNLKLEQLLFEVISALSTVGLSMDVTPQLSTMSKGLVGILMFVGRVGIFTVIYSLNTKDRQEQLYKYPEENVMIG